MRKIIKLKMFQPLLMFTAVIFILTLVFYIYGNREGFEEFLYPRSNALGLTIEHLYMVFVSAGFSVVAGVFTGVLVTRKFWSDLLPAVNSLASVGQTFPPVAVLALAVPVVGFGFKPTIIALILYGFFPIVRNTIAGIESVPKEVREAAKGMGMTGVQILSKVELPLASKIILAGIRTSVIINIGTATIGATIGAGGLGAPIISGLINENFYYVFQGSLCVGLLAVVADKAIEDLGRLLFE
ncbi:MAG TPA: ABC transporter [Flexistipes sinusarabici]|uniref:ABC transporter n=1 Tax=Flexistipes sinusarabici TaxID=2352 RepID=A0A3D5QBS2_FLESI|nr:ABC transporter [Flexistipes sinusarabici]